ncbi:hypothetical protein NHJ13051_008459 [Beauveria bassiana]
MKFTIFSTLCLGFSSAALAAPQSIEDTHQLVERVPEPKARLEARLSYPGTCNRDDHTCYFKWTEGALTGKGKCNCTWTTCKTNSGYCSYNYNTAACICT